MRNLLVLFLEWKLLVGDAEIKIKEESTQLPIKLIFFMIYPNDGEHNASSKIKLSKNIHLNKLLLLSHSTALYED